MRVPTLALLVLLPLAAGCLGEAPGITAREAADRAGERARAWQADAVLVALGGAENGNASAYAGTPFGAGAPADPRVGDGRAPGWGLAFHSASANRTLGLVVLANGTILADAIPGDAVGEAQPIHRWEVDSPAAAEAARRDPGVADIVARPDATFALLLGTPDPASDPLWNFHAVSAEAGRAAAGTVNARTGELLAARVEDLPPGGPWGRDFAMPPGPEEYRNSGTVTPAEPGFEDTFAVLEGHTTMVVDFRSDGRLPSDRASYEVRSPSGQVVATSAGFFGGGAFFDGDTADLDEAGEYSLLVRYESEVPGVPGPLQGTDWRIRIFVT